MPHPALTPTPNHSDEKDHNIYFENNDSEIKPKKSKFKLFLKLFVFLAIFSVIGLTLFSNSSAKKTNDKASTSWLDKISLVGQLKQLAESADRKLKGEERDRINILLLGIGGKNHDGAYLTDTIMILSIQPSTKRISMISVPRDLSVPIEGYGWRKINAVDSFAESANPGSGGLAVSQSISQLFNVPIDYYLRVDFEGFSKIIDQLGGLDVTVAHTLDDYNYPVLGMEDAKSYNSRYEHLHVEAGQQHMDGSLALKFARSRHGVDGEGSDFARAKRQQIIIEAVKNKLFSMSTLLNPNLISNLITDYQEHVSTNLQVWEMLKLWTMSKSINHDQIINKVLDNSPSGLLVDQRGIDGAYLLAPKSGDFSQIQYLIANVFNDAPSADKQKIVAEQATVELFNGTWVNGLAGKVSTDLESLGFKISSVSNASQRNFQKSVIYDLTNGDNSKSGALTTLKEKTNANVSLVMPQWLLTDLAKDKASDKNFIQPNFVLILGQSADASASGTTNNN